jgi:hypothetical protein
LNSPGVDGLSLGYDTSVTRVVISSAACAVCATVASNFAVALPGCSTAAAIELARLYDLDDSFDNPAHGRYRCRGGGSHLFKMTRDGLIMLLMGGQTIDSLGPTGKLMITHADACAELTAGHHILLLMQHDQIRLYSVAGCRNRRQVGSRACG